MAVGFGMFGFTFVLASGVALAYVTDCYQEVRRRLKLPNYIADTNLTSSRFSETL